MDTQNTHFKTLKSLVEKILSHPLKTSKDFAELHDKMQDSNGETLGTTTLKRIWNYIGGDNALRESTLDVLCRFVGYSDWNTFVADCCGETDRETSKMVVTKTVRSEQLNVGEKLEIRWNPNRHLILKYLGNNTFDVIVAENSKINPGMKLRCERFTIGLPLYVDILNDGQSPALFEAGKKGGLTKITILSGQ